jgi:hypothetical protein
LAGFLVGRLRINIFEFGFVEDWAADAIFLAGPIAEVEQAAALAAKREVGVSFGIGFFSADRAATLHGSYIIKARWIFSRWKKEKSRASGIESALRGWNSAIGRHSAPLFGFPALPGWANFWRAYGASDLQFLTLWRHCAGEAVQHFRFAQCKRVRVSSFPTKSVGTQKARRAVFFGFPSPSGLG